MADRLAAVLRSFNGVAENAHPARLPDGKWEVDEGGSRFEQGSWRTRRGQERSNLDTRAEAVTSLFGFAAGGSGFKAIAGHGASSSGVSDFGAQDGSVSATSLSTSLTASHRAEITAFRQRAYLSNGWNAMKSWDGLASSLSGVGIEGPSAVRGTWTPTPTANTPGSGESAVTKGIHGVRYRYLDSRNGYVSNASEEREFTSDGSNTYSFAISTTGASNMIRSSDSKVDKIVVEVTDLAGTWFVGAIVDQADASAEVALDDRELQRRPLSWPDIGHGLPPVRKYVVSHRGRLWAFGSIVYSTGTVTTSNGSPTVTGSGTGWSQDALGSSAGDPPRGGRAFIRFGTEDRVYEISHAGSATSLTLSENYAGSGTSGQAYEIFWTDNNVFVSRADYPESFPEGTFIPQSETPLNGPLTAGVGFGEHMLFFTANSTFRLVWTSEPWLDGIRRPIPGFRGALNQRVVQVIDDMGSGGSRAYSLDRTGFWVYDGAEPIDIGREVETTVQTINWSAAEEFSSVYLPKERAVRWYVAVGNDTKPKNYVQLDLGSMTWGTGKLDVAVTEARLVLTSNGPIPCTGDENGHTWIIDRGKSEGIGLVLSVGSGASTTSIPTTATSLKTTGTGLDGMSAYWVEGNEVSVISANTSDTLTVGALTAAPAEGDTVLVGRIPSRLKSRAIVSQADLAHKQVWGRCHVFCDAAASYPVLVRFYIDDDQDARPFTADDFEDSSEEAGIVPPGVDARFTKTTTPGSDLANPWVIYPARSSPNEPTGRDLEVRIPLGLEPSRTIAVEIESYYPGIDLEVLGIALVGREGHGSS